MIILRESVHGAASLASLHWMTRKEVKASLDDTVRLPARLCLVLYPWQKKWSGRWILVLPYITQEERYLEARQGGSHQSLGRLRQEDDPCSRPA